MVEENYFDDVANGTEYPEFIPHFKGWDKEAFDVKTAHIARVITDMNAQVVALEEVENENALNALLAKLKADGDDYPYHAITDAKKSAIQSALISKFKIVSTDEVIVDRSARERPILKVVLQVGVNKLTVYVNHWKAKTGPESRRIAFARAMEAEIQKIPSGVDYIVLGDLNSNYNEAATFINDSKLNDTMGLTGINHILKTAKSMPNQALQFNSKADVLTQNGTSLLYDLWLEIPPYERGSEWFAREKDTPNNIILPKSLFDTTGISYVDESFRVFNPPYLLKNNRPFRWEGAGSQKAKSTPQGFSDHLPVLAKFRTAPFRAVSSSAQTATDSSNVQKTVPQKGNVQAVKNARIVDIYTGKIGTNADVILKNCVVTYKHFSDIIIKQKNGRAIYIYNAPSDMELGGIYDVRIGKIEDYHGLKEVKSVIDHAKVGMSGIEEYYVKQVSDLTNASLQNEIVSGMSGLFSRGKFVYNGGKEIKIYFKDKNLRPKNMTNITLQHVHIGFYNEPQLVVYQADDIRVMNQ